jgi:exonuclease III
MINNEQISSQSCVVIGTYNCRGLRDDRCEYMFRLLNQVDVLFIQEHWMSDDQLDNFQAQHDIYLHGVCGFASNEVLSGRPYGGCAIICNRRLHAEFTPVESNSKRECALICALGKVKILLINVYLPYENDEDSHEEFSLQLAIIDDIIERNSDCQVVCGEDFNVDFSRDRNHNIL